jgi:signal transduction histidine kinase
MRPNSIIILFVVSLSLLWVHSYANTEVVDIRNLPLTKLEERLSTIDSELKQLASYSLRTGIGAVGFRSDDHGQKDQREWIQIDLEAETPIDQVVLVPVVWRDTRSGFTADGFPVEFKIIAGNQGNETGKIIASYSAEDNLLPRIGPLVIPCPKISASWIRIETSVLSKRAWDGRFILQLDEVLVFSGTENVALKKPVKTSSLGEPARGSRESRYLVDGFVPYLMDAYEGEQSIAFLSSFDSKYQPEFFLDLGNPYPLNRIHLHTIELSDTIPQPSPPGMGIPNHLLVEGSLDPDFSNPTRLVDFQLKTLYDAGPIIMRTFPETVCRYIRITIIEPFFHKQTEKVEPLMGFAEIEIFSDGKNVALGIPTVTDSSIFQIRRELSALTDGNNLYGKILPVREWLEQLARRHELETERPLILAELNQRYIKQSKNLTLLKWLVLSLAIGIVFLFLIDRIIRMRQVAGIKERLAADLHDELGADLHTIGLLSDLAEDARNSPEELSMLHQRIRRVTEQTGTAVRHCTNMLEANGYNTNVADTIRRASRRIMAKLENEISIEGEEDLNKLKPRTRFDLVLFYNECLVNISRHSGATKFRTHLTADPKNVTLSVWDNGRGLSESTVNEIPKSLKRRARFLGAKVGVVSPDSGGTCINLQLRTQKWGRRK